MVLCCVTKCLRGSSCRDRCAAKAAKMGKNVPVDGVFGPRTTLALQMMLEKEGAEPGPVDGWFGKRTKKALQRYLIKQGYELGPVDGWFGRRSRAALSSWLCSQAGVGKGLEADQGTHCSCSRRFDPKTVTALQTVLNGMNASDDADGPDDVAESVPVPSATPVVDAAVTIVKAD